MYRYMYVQVHVCTVLKELMQGVGSDGGKNVQCRGHP